MVVAAWPLDDAWQNPHRHRWSALLMGVPRLSG